MASYPPTYTEMPMPSYPPPPGHPQPTATPDPRVPPPSGVHLTRDADYLIQSFLPQTELVPRFQTPKLPLPYCAPQLMPAFDAPFCRAYNSTLESVDISQEQLLAFIDGLNLAMTASPPLRVVNLVGMAVGFVPYHWMWLAGAAIQAGAQAGIRVLSKTLTDRYLRAANLRLFKPRGLSVRICTTAAVQHLVMGTPIEPPPSKITSVGRGVGTVLMKVPIPLASVLVHAIADKPPTVRAMDPASSTNKKLLAAQRRAAMLEGYALPLDFNMPKAAKAEGVMDTMSSWGVKFDSWRDGRNQSKAENARLELERERSQGGQSQSSGGRGGLLGGGGGGGLVGGFLNRGSGGQLRDRFGGDRSGGGDGRRRLGNRGVGGGLMGLVGGLVSGGGGEDRSGRRDASGVGGAAGRQSGGIASFVGQTAIGSRVMGRGSGGGILGRRGGPVELQVKDADLIEHWQSAKVLWVVIMNSDMDDEIEGIEQAESREDEERVDEQTWRAEMQVEREDREFDAELERVAENQAQKSPGSSH